MGSIALLWKGANTFTYCSANVSREAEGNITHTFYTSYVGIYHKWSYNVFEANSYLYKKAVDKGHVFIIMFPLSSGKSWSMFPLQAPWPSVPSVTLPIKISSKISSENTALLVKISLMQWFSHKMCLKAKINSAHLLFYILT